MRIVHIRTEDFEADALFIGEMPANQVIRISAESHPGKQGLLAYQLFKRAIVDQDKRRDFEALSFDQAIRVLTAYSTASPVDVPITFELEEN